MIKQECIHSKDKYSPMWGLVDRVQGFLDALKCKKIISVSYCVLTDWNYTQGEPENNLYAVVVYEV